MGILNAMAIKCPPTVMITWLAMLISSVTKLVVEMSFLLNTKVKYIHQNEIALNWLKIFRKNANRAKPKMIQ